MTRVILVAGVIQRSRAARHPLPHNTHDTALMPNRLRVAALLLSTVTSLAALSACSRGHHLATPLTTTVHAGAADAELARLRAATRAFQNLDSAVAAGYARTVADCIVHEHHGAMGYHHLNRAYLTATPVVERPQILLYARTPDSTYRLNGVEFIVPYQLHPRDSTPPVLFGQRLRAEDHLNYWYLHVWAWSANPDGMFADFNPTVACPSGGKVYRAFSRDDARPSP